MTYMTYDDLRVGLALGRDSAKWLDAYPIEGKKPRELKAAHYDEDSGLTVAVFSDGSKLFIRCDEKDEFDKRIAVALALAYDRFGSKRKFHEFVDKVAKPTKKKEPVKKKESKKEKKNGDQG